MTGRELRLRTRIDQLLDRISELEEARGHCSYCGASCAWFVCDAHADLRALDPGLRRELSKLRDRVREVQKQRDRWKDLARGYETELGLRRRPREPV